MNAPWHMCPEVFHLSDRFSTDSEGAMLRFYFLYAEPYEVGWLNCILVHSRELEKDHAGFTY